MSSGLTLIPLGTLDRVKVRSAWPDEARNFTPWMAKEGIALLSSEIGVDLKILSCEHAVGRYSLDILAAPSGTDAEQDEAQLVVIENQFGATDHDHLGKLMTYASGVGKENQGAKTIIWIAEELREEHRQALEWLNEVTQSGIRFYGVQLELYRIGDSPAAPALNVVVRPNEIVRARRDASTPTNEAETERALFYIEYWTAFKGYCADRDARFSLQSPRPASYIFAALGRAGVHISFVAARRDKWIGCELYIADADPSATFLFLERDRASIDSALPNLVWEQKPGTKSAKVYSRLLSPPGNRDLWADQHEWLLQQGNQFFSEFEPRLRTFK